MTRHAPPRPWGPVLGLALLAPALGAAPAEPPNLLIVFPDQWRGQALGFLKEDPVVTPRLDRFAEESVVFTHAVSNYPVCSPFRAMLMTGAYPHVNRVLTNCNSRSEPHGCELPTDARCWSDVLKDRGYSLGYIGKWHLDSPRPPYVDCANNRGPLKWNEWCPPARRHGFDFWHAYGTYDFHLKPMYWDTKAPRNGFRYVDQWGPEYEADLAIRYIRNEGGAFRAKGRPFALVVSMNPPHTPYTLFPKRYLKAYAGRSDKDLLVRPNVDTGGKTKMSRLALTQTRNYFANITGVDDQFGRILDALDAAGLKEKTIVVFASDHGNCVGTHNQATKNNIYEESMRIPMIVRWPGRIVPRRDDLLISVPDLAPTLLDLMGLEEAIPASMQGTSHARVFRTGEGPRPTSQLYLKINPAEPDLGSRGIRTHRHKLILTFSKDGATRTTLFDLKADPYELKNIAAEKPDLVKELTGKELIPWLKRTDDPALRRVRGE
jgi:arylsulfatase A-like enzyme